MTLEKIFENVCKEGMVQFDLANFKKTHPKLYSCIISSIGISFAEGLKQGRRDGNMISKESMLKQAGSKN